MTRSLQVPVPRAEPPELVATGAGAAALRAVFGCMPSGVAAVGAIRDGEPVGMTVCTLTPVSLDPPLMSLCIQNASATWPRLRTAARVGISVLSQAHEHVGAQLAARSPDRFAGLDVHVTDHGAVLIAGAAAWLECAVRAEVPAGDHAIVLLDVHTMHGEPDVAPLVFLGSRYRHISARPRPR